MKTLLFLAIVMSALPLLAQTTCPDLTGRFKITKVVNPDGTVETNTKNIIVISQTETCGELRLSNSENTENAQVIIPDGKIHPWIKIEDVHVAISLTAKYEGDALIGLLSMEGIGDVGGIKLSLDATGKVLTFVMSSLQGIGTTIAEKQ